MGDIGRSGVGDGASRRRRATAGAPDRPLRVVGEGKELPRTPQVRICRTDMWNMRVSHVRPTGVERTFGEDEIIVSKTDAKGIIRYANGVFLRVSGYEEADVLGQPHNIIRHPEMPRCIFRLLWDTIASGEEIFAYVLNLAADGAHYWVFAHVTPSFGPRGEIIGYHSNRRLPDGPDRRHRADLRRAPRRGAATQPGVGRGRRRHRPARRGPRGPSADLRRVRLERRHHDSGDDRSRSMRRGRTMVQQSTDALESCRPTARPSRRSPRSAGRSPRATSRPGCPPLAGPAEVAEVRAGLNHLIDITDAFVREAGASLTAAGRGALPPPVPRPRHAGLLRPRRADDQRRPPGHGRLRRLSSRPTAPVAPRSPRPSTRCPRRWRPPRPSSARSAGCLTESAQTADAQVDKALSIVHRMESSLGGDPARGHAHHDGRGPDQPARPQRDDRGQPRGRRRSRLRGRRQRGQAARARDRDGLHRHHPPGLGGQCARPRRRSRRSA